MSKVRCKMMCEAVNHLPTGRAEDVCASVTLRAVYQDGNTENANWSKYTPSGHMTINITNPTAIDAFSPGKFYYIDFTPAD